MRRRWQEFAVVVLSTALAWVSPGRSQELLLGTEFQVNLRTQDDQRYPAIAAEDDGDFIVVWQSDELAGGDDYSIVGRRYSRDGDALDSEFRVNTYTFGQQLYPAVAADADGDFVVVWQSDGQDGYYTDIFGRRFSSTGVAQGVEFLINTVTGTFHGSASVAAADNGDFVVVWGSENQDGSRYGIFGRRFASNGGALGVEFAINTYTSGGQSYPSVSAASNGDFVVAWQSSSQGAFVYDVIARRFSSTGAALSGEIRVNTRTANDQSNASVSADIDGDFVVAWQSVNQDGQGNGIFAQRFSSSGVPVGGEFQVNSYTVGDQYAPVVAADHDGDFVVSWHSDGQDGVYFDFDVFGRRFSRFGVGLGAEFQVNTYTDYNQSFPSVARFADGDFVIAWQSNVQDADDRGVFAQRYAVTHGATFVDIDGNGGLDAFTDGVLLIRHEFLFVDPVLTAGATGAGCSRCDGPSVSVYIQGLGLALDIDGDGDVRPLTDALLVLRHLLGFTGPALIGGAVDSDCTNCTAEEIESVLLGLSGLS